MSVIIVRDLECTSITRTDLSLFPRQLFEDLICLSATRSIKQADVGFPLALLYTVFQYAINDVVVRMKRSCMAEIPS